MKKKIFFTPVILYLVMGLGMLSCSFRPKPVIIKSYVIDSGNRVSKVIKPQPKPFPHTLLLTPILGALPMRTRRILYRNSDVSLSPYLYSRWEYAPTRMLMTKFLRAIATANIFMAVAYRASGARGDLLLETTLFDFSHHINPRAKTSDGVIAIMFQLVKNSSRNIVATKMFTIRKPTPTMNAQGAAVALNEASDALCLKLIDWLRKTVPPLSAKR